MVTKEGERATAFILDIDKIADEKGYKRQDVIELFKVIAISKMSDAIDNVADTINGVADEIEGLSKKLSEEVSFLGDKVEISCALDEINQNFMSIARSIAEMAFPGQIVD